jgi:hypothetical protein
MGAHLNRQYFAGNRGLNPVGKDGGRAERPATMPGTDGRIFGIYDRVACSVCGQDTYLRRRSPHSAGGDACEFQTFACRACKAFTTRIVDSKGMPR